MERGLAQLAGARVRALAAFARCRPVAWDRQPGEPGAASAASREARPAALTAVSEWAADEVAARLRLPAGAASELLVESVELVEQLPATLAALEAGEIGWAQARALVELLRPVAAGKKAAVQARVLPRAPRQTVAQLRECTRRAIARIDADAALARLAAAVRGRKVTLHAGEDGMAVLTAVLPAPVARACHEALRGYATATADTSADTSANTSADTSASAAAGTGAAAGGGPPDPRSSDERMADTFADLLLRPDAEGRAPVRVLLTVVARAGTLTGTGPDADEPGELDGHTVPAPLVRELAHTLGLLPRPNRDPEVVPAADEADLTADTVGDPPAVGAEPAQAAPSTDDAVPAQGAVPAQDVALLETVAPTEGVGSDKEALPAEDVVSPDGAPPAEEPAPAEQIAPTEQVVLAEAALARLLDLRRLGDTALAERPRIALTDPLTGCLLALTDSIELRAAARDGTGLGPPPETPGYTPSAPLDRFVRLRDRRCRFPGCRARARRGDLDHRIPHPHGPTAHTNLEALCEHHHRLSHQAPGWRLEGRPDQALIWVLPGGTRITTAPPSFGTDDGSQPTPAPATDTGGAPSAIDWRRLTPEERRERIRMAVCGRPAQPADEPAPF
ncbi:MULTISPECIES: DUF222 domain-containing protein [unclassified Blastococcus]